MTNPIPFLYSCSSECVQDPKTCNPLVALALGLGARDEVKCIRLLCQMLDLLPMGVWVLNGDGGVLYSNPIGRKQLSAAGLQDGQSEARSAVKARWRKCGELVEPHEWSYAKAMTTGKAYLADEIQFEYADGSTNFIESSALPVHDAAGEVRTIMVVNLDISSRVETEEALRSLAEIDMLTGANTRRKFFRLLDLEIERHTRYSRILSAIIFDIDHFKRVNDHHGHLRAMTY